MRLQALPRKQAAIGDVGAGAFTGGGDLASPFSSSHSAASQLRSALASEYWKFAPSNTTLFYAPKLGLVGQTGPQSIGSLGQNDEAYNWPNNTFQFQNFAPICFERLYNIFNPR